MKVRSEFGSLFSLNSASFLMAFQEAKLSSLEDWRSKHFSKDDSWNDGNLTSGRNVHSKRRIKWNYEAYPQVGWGRRNPQNDHQRTYYYIHKVKKNITHKNISPGGEGRRIVVPFGDHLTISNPYLSNSRALKKKLLDHLKLGSCGCIDCSYLQGTYH